MKYAFLVWSLLLCGVWLVIYIFLLDKRSRFEMLVVSLATSLLGLSEPLFVPAYWNPPTLFDLAKITRFDIESLLFSFGVGGIAAAAYEGFFKPRHTSMSQVEKSRRRHRLHLLALISAPLTFAVLYILTGLNPIYNAGLAFLVGGLASIACRPDLTKKMILTGLGFLIFYFVFFETLVIAYPRYVDLVWNLSDISGILVLGIPIEELMFALGLGFMWSSVYEHITWTRLEAHKH